MNDTSELKGLRTRRNKIEDELRLLNAEIGRLSSERDAKMKIVKQITDTIQSIEKSAKGIIVSEHAIMRYIERVLGFDVEKIKAGIVADVSSKWATLGDGTYPISTSGASVVVKNNTVITVKTKSKESQ